MISTSANSNEDIKNWFLSDVIYQGQGRAEFNTPNGFIEGFTKIHFDEFGNSTLDNDCR